MATLHVCSLARLDETVMRTKAQFVVTLVTAGTHVVRPASVAEDNHLFLAMNDITTPVPGMTPPAEHHVRALLEFVTAWDRSAPMVIHCWAGISRSTASAYIAALALNPTYDDFALARHLREASPSATPNPRLIAIADQLLGRNGRMIEAIEAIGRGQDAFEGVPFELSLGQLTPPHESG